MQLVFLHSTPTKDTIKVCSNKSKTKACDLNINNFVHIINAAISMNSLVFKESHNRVITFDMTALNKHLVKGFLNRMVQSFYEFTKYKTKAKKDIVIQVYAPQLPEKDKKSIAGMIEYANYTRDLLNEPANKLVPTSFADNVASDFSEYKNVNIKILHSDEIKRQGLGLVDAIGSSSSNGARLLIIEYVPKGCKKTICLVGKGVTIDTGGYSLKNRAGMYNMHMDKTGASICVGIIKHLADHHYKNKVIAIMPLVENVVSDVAAKPADVVKAYNGQTVEIVDVDAEGRLILADGLAYACKNYKPDYIMDFGTLTGWSDAIHCHTSFTYFTMNDRLAKIVEDMGESNAERSFRIPPWSEYSIYLVSDKADIKNYGYKCMNSDGLMASVFLMNFVEKQYRDRWVHFDIRLLSFINSLGIADGFATYLQFIQKL